MSHFPERTDKNCLNCGAEVLGRYCQNCGQENLEPKETFWHLVTHFVNDVTHFDGKFFSTLKFLLFRPGFLSKEYVRGRRMSYLHPIRMYVFTSAIFFIIFFSLIGDKGMMGAKTENFSALNSQRNDLFKELKTTTDLEDRRDLLRDIYRKDTDIVRLSEIRRELSKDGFRLDGDTAGMGIVIASVKQDSLAWKQGIAAVKADQRKQENEENRISALDRQKDSLQREKDRAQDAAETSPENSKAPRSAGSAYHYSGPGKSHVDSLRRAAALTGTAAAKAGSTAVVPELVDRDSTHAEDDEDDSIALRGIETVTKITSAADSNTVMGIGGERLPTTIEEYDSRQLLLKASDRDPWIKRLANRRLIILHQEYHENKKGFQKELTEATIHTFPKILFVSLPFFALMLRLLNLSRRKEILYVDHGIFTIHLYCASFIIILAMMLVNKLFDLLFRGNLEWIPDLILVLLFFFYQYKAMHNFYRQGRAKTIVKMVILDFCSIFIVTFTLVIFVLWTFMEI